MMDMERVGREMRGHAVVAFRLNRGLMVEFDGESIAYRPSMFVPRGQVWTNRGSKIVAPQEWIDEALR